MSVRFRFDWVDVPSSPDDLARHTMAALSIEAAGATITSVLDRRSRAWRDHVVVPLFTVAEWLVGNWWHLFHEIESTGEQKSGFELRHNLAFAGDGFILPSLIMVPAPDRVHLRWRRHRPEHARIEFVDEGEASVGREELESQFRDLIDAVLERLRGTGAALESPRQRMGSGQFARLRGTGIQPGGRASRRRPLRRLRCSGRRNRDVLGARRSGHTRGRVGRGERGLAGARGTLAVPGIRRP